MPALHLQISNINANSGLTQICQKIQRAYGLNPTHQSWISMVELFCGVKHSPSVPALHLQILNINVKFNSDTKVKCFASFSSCIIFLHNSDNSWYSHNRCASTAFTNLKYQCKFRTHTNMWHKSKFLNTTHGPAVQFQLR